MEKEVHPNWINWRRAHREWFQENGIESIFEYLVEFTGPEKISNAEELRTEAETLRDRARAAGVYDELRQVGLHGFERPSIANDQDVMFVLLNPRLSLNTGNFIDKIQKEDTNYTLGQTDEADPTAELTLGAGAGLNWFLNKKTDFGVQQRFTRPLVRSLDQYGLIDLTGDVGDQEPKKDRNLSEQIYYTTWFKYATPLKTDLQGWQEKPVSESVQTQLTTNQSVETGKELMTTILLEEIRHIDPEVVIPFGKSSWSMFVERSKDRSNLASVAADYDHDPLDPYGAKGKQPSKAHGFLYRYEDEGIGTHLLPLSFPGRPWTTFRNHGRFDREDTEDLSKRATHVSQKRIDTSLQAVTNRSE